MLTQWIWRICYICFGFPCVWFDWIGGTVLHTDPKWRLLAEILVNSPQCMYCDGSCTMSVQHMFSMPDISSNSTCEPPSAEADTWQPHPWQIIAFYFMCLMLPSAWCSLVWGRQEERRRLVTPLAPILLCNQPDPGLRCSALRVCF